MIESSEKPVIVIGGGPAGLNVAKGLADNGIASTILEKDSQLGGWTNKWPCLATDHCLRCFVCHVNDLREAVEESDYVKVILDSACSSVTEETGDFLVTYENLKTGAKDSVGASRIAIATGFEPYDPTEKMFWGYGRLKGVHTLPELSQAIRRHDLSTFIGPNTDPLNIAFFQCIGSRDRSINANYCSQYCCKTALKAALKLLSLFPDWNVTIFYIDLQIAGKMADQLMDEAVSKGVRLVQGVPGEITQAEDDKLEIVIEENGRNTKERFDNIILSVGQRPRKFTPFDSYCMEIKSNESGYFMAADQLAPWASNINGAYLAGSCEAPMDLETTLLQSGQATLAIIKDILATRENGDGS